MWSVRNVSWLAKWFCVGTTRRRKFRVHALCTSQVPMSQSFRQPALSASSSPAWTSCCQFGWHPNVDGRIAIFCWHAFGFFSDFRCIQNVAEVEHITWEDGYMHSTSLNRFRTHRRCLSVYGTDVMCRECGKCAIWTDRRSSLYVRVLECRQHGLHPHPASTLDSEKYSWAKCD